MFSGVVMLESRRRLLSILAGALGVLATRPLFSGAQLPRPSRDPRPYPNGRNPGLPPDSDDSSTPARKDTREENQKQIRDDVARLYEMAAQLKSEVEKTDANSTLSIAVVKKAQRIKKLAKQIQDLAKS